MLFAGTRLGLEPRWVSGGDGDGQKGRRVDSQITGSVEPLLNLIFEPHKHV